MYLEDHPKRFIFHTLRFNPFTPTDRFSLIQNNDWKSPLKLLSVERVKRLYLRHLHLYIENVFDLVKLL